jgi:uncharacterized membrane protein YsdA (DUF1294 family)
MLLGTSAMTSNLLPYFQSYYSEATAPRIASLSAIGVLSGMVGNFIGSNLIRRKVMHPKLFLIISGFGGVLGIYIASNCTSFYGLALFYSIIRGFWYGFSSIVTIYVAW